MRHDTGLPANRSVIFQLKLRNQVTTEQEKLLGEKNKEMEEIRKELEQVKVAFSQKEEEVRDT